MGRRCLPIVAIVVCAVLAVHDGPVRHAPGRSVIRATWPLAFEPNRGQADPQVEFIAHGAGYSLGLGGGTARLALRDDALGISLAHANPAARPHGVDARSTRVNYFLGNDPAHWLVDVPTYDRVRYDSVYPGVDLVFYGNQQQLEYDLIVQPGADPARIALRLEGAERLALDSAGDLEVTLGTGRQLRQRRPSIYQLVDGVRRPIDGGYTLEGNAGGAGGDVARFWIGPYDRDATLTIDPIVVYSHAFGGSRDYADSIAVDAKGNTYITGSTQSTEFPVSATGMQRSLHAKVDAFVAKIDASGANLMYATYLGGNSVPYWYDDDGCCSEGGTGIAVDGSGNVYVTGFTDARDFPTVNAYQSQQNNAGIVRDAFVAKLNSTGSALMYSTYLGGRSGVTSSHAIAVDAIGNAYVVGGTASSQFPTTTMIGPPAARGVDSQPFVTKFNPAGGLVYSTRLGGSVFGRAFGVAVDGAGQVHVAGTTFSPDFPIVNGWLTTCPRSVLSSSCVGGFLAKLSVSGTAIVYSTYLGGDSSVWDEANAVTVDAAGNAYVVGVTSSTTFRTVNPFQGTYNGGYGDAFVASFTPGGAVRYATYLGGAGWEQSVTASADPGGNLWVAGTTDSTDFPVSQPLVETHPGGPVFRSNDRATRWTPVGKGLTSGVTAIAIDPRTPTTLYAATGRGVFKTTDGAATWITSSTGLPQAVSIEQERDKGITSLVIDPDTPATLYAVTGLGGIYKSVDAGAHWSTIGLSGVGGTVVFDPSASSTLFVWSYTGIRKSTDGGRTWINVDAGLGSPPQIVAFAAGRGTLYAGRSTDRSVIGSSNVFKSTDGGVSWRQATSAGRFAGALTVDPTDGRTLYTTDYDGRVLRSTDEAGTWTQILDVRSHPWSVIIAPSAAIYVLTSSAPCVLRSVDGGKTWDPVSAGPSLDLCDINTLAVDPVNTATVYATRNRVTFAPFLTRLAPDGSLTFSTYLSGFDAIVTADVNGNAYLAGRTNLSASATVQMTKIGPPFRMPAPPPRQP